MFDRLSSPEAWQTLLILGGGGIILILLGALADWLARGRDYDTLVDSGYAFLHRWVHRIDGGLLREEPSDQ